MGSNPTRGRAVGHTALERALHSPHGIVSLPADVAHPVSPPRPRDSVETLFERFLERAAARSGGRPPSLREWVDLAEAWRISHALRQCRGNRSAAARALGIGRRTLYSKMEKLGIEPLFSPWGAPAAGDRRGEP